MDIISRRKFIAAGTAAGVLAATGMLTGCAPSQEQTEESLDEEGAFDVLGDYLPLGSVVVLKGSEDLDVQFMVVARRPNVTTMRDDAGEQVPLGYVYDYAGVQWPVGFLTDLSKQGQGAECLGFNREDIGAIEFVGCRSGREEKARELLNAAYGTMDTCAVTLLELQQDIVAKFPEDQDAQ